MSRAQQPALAAQPAEPSCQDLDAWRAAGLQAELAARERRWADADRLAATFCSLRPDWPKGYLLRQRTMARLGADVRDVAEMLRQALVLCGTAADGAQLQEALVALEPQLPGNEPAPVDAPAAGPAGPAKARGRVKGLKLLPHEQELVEQGELADVTHDGSSAIWLSAESAELRDESLALVYRPMGDAECAHLLAHGVLPDSQPYQTIVEGAGGRVYAEKYLRGHKSVDSSPTTVVEFAAPKALVAHLFATQSKNEDGAISHGLGAKGGRGLPLFNASLQRGEITFRIVSVKRFAIKAVGAFGANRRRC